MDINDEDWNKPYVKLEGKFVEIKNGYITDRQTGIATKLKFYYLSYCNKMVHMDFEDAIYEIKQALKHHKCPPNVTRKHKPKIGDNEYSALLKKIEQLKESVDKKLLNYTEKNPETSPEKRNKLDTSQINNKTLVPTDKRSNETYILSSHETSSAKSLDADANTTEVLNKRKLSFCVDVEDLQVIGRWANRNRDFIPYKGILEVPEGTFESDTDYVYNLLFSLNPYVDLTSDMIQQLHNSGRSLNGDKISLPETKYYDSQSDMTQSEFVQQLGLVHSQSLKSTLKPPRKPRACKDLNRSLNLQNIQKENIGVVLKQSVNRSEKEVPEAMEPFSIIDKWKSGCQLKARGSVRSDKKLDALKPISYNIKDNKFYTTEEDRKIIDWVLEENNYLKVNGNEIWKNLEQQKIARGRTWQSLRNRFLKTILSQLGDYGLPQRSMSTIIKGARKGNIKRKSKELFASPNVRATNKLVPLNNAGFFKSKSKNIIIPSNYSDPKENQKPKMLSPTRISQVKRLKHDKKKSENISRNSIFRSRVREHADLPNQDDAKTTRSKARKLFTQATFVASMSESIQ